MLIGRKTIGTVGFMGGVPTTPTPFTKAWGDIIQYNYEYLLQPTQRIQYIHSTVSYHSLARDGLVDSMKGDWLLMLDMDVIPEPDIVYQMLYQMNTHKIDVLLGIYPYKGRIHAPVLYGYNPRKKSRFIIGDWDSKFDVIPCDGAGAGCLMIRKSVVDKIKATGESLFSIKEPYSEDNSFFMRCRELKIPIYFSPKIRLQHLTYKGLTIEEDYPKKYRITKLERKVIGRKTA